LGTILFLSHEILTVCTINTTSIMNIMKQRALFLVMKIYPYRSPELKINSCMEGRDIASLI
jgi:hypothetical protein